MDYWRRNEGANKNMVMYRKEWKERIRVADYLRGMEARLKKKKKKTPDRTHRRHLDICLGGKL